MSRRSRVQPLVLGPDVDGCSVVVAGDRICFTGTGPIPQTPGARRIAAPDHRLAPGDARVLDARDERFDLGQALDSACGEGVTTVMVRLVACDGDRLRARMRQVTETGLRAVFALAPDTEGEQRSRRVGDALITSNALNRVRIAWLTDSAVEGDAFGVAERCFGRRLGVLTPGAVGDVVVRGRYGAPRHVVVAGRVLS